MARQMEPSAVRERILETASKLFYADGVRAVGVDLIVAQSGVAKTSLYRYFPTKDALVAAFLEREDADFWRVWEEVARKHEGDARGELEAQVAWIVARVTRRGYRGCPQLNVANEFPAPDHPARAVAIAHKAELRRRLRQLAEAMDVARPRELADQLALVVDGAFVSGAVLGTKGPAHSLTSTVQALIAAAERAR
jgi:AcrR family transcriptional regulator